MNSVRHIDALQVALLRASQYTVMPELYEIFGKEHLLKFLDIFAGTTIVVPSKVVLEQAIKATYIYLTLEKYKKGGAKKREVIRELAVRYGCSVNSVLVTYKDMKKYF